MSNRIISRFQQLWAKSKSKVYRDSFVASQLRTSLAAQIVTMREDRGLTQQQLADATGMSQPRISLLEDPSYDKMSLSTLKRLASALDVAIVVRFVAFSDVLRWTNTASPEGLGAVSFEDDHPPEAETQITQAEIPPVSTRMLGRGIELNSPFKPASAMIGTPSSAASYLVTY